MHIADFAAGMRSLFKMQLLWDASRRINHSAKVLFKRHPAMSDPFRSRDSRLCFGWCWMRKFHAKGSFVWLG